MLSGEVPHSAYQGGDNAGVRTRAGTASSERQSSIILQEETGMDLFTQIKMAVSVKEAAEYYGLEVNRGNMTRCPFHADRTPSMKLNEDYFYCFGCGGNW
jgi:DNA primase (bacterial type)